MFKLVVTTYNCTFIRLVETYPVKEDIVSSLLGLVDAAYTDAYKKENVVGIEVNFEVGSLVLIDLFDGEEQRMEHDWKVIGAEVEIPINSPPLESVRKNFRFLPLTAYLTHRAPTFRALAKADLKPNLVIVKCGLN